MMTYLLYGDHLSKDLPRISMSGTCRSALLRRGTSAFKTVKMKSHTTKKSLELQLKGNFFSYVVEEPDPGRNADFLLDFEGVAGIRVEVYRYIYFGFVGHSLDLCCPWLCHLLESSGCGGDIGNDHKPCDLNLVIFFDRLGTHLVHHASVNARTAKHPVGSLAKFSEPLQVF